jgi:hypothetical protein
MSLACYKRSTSRGAFQQLATVVCGQQLLHSNHLLWWHCTWRTAKGKQAVLLRPVMTSQHQEWGADGASHASKLGITATRLAFQPKRFQALRQWQVRPLPPKLLHLFTLLQPCLCASTLVAVRTRQPTATHKFLLATSHGNHLQ